MTTRTILHVDLDAFFCSVEELQRPELKGKPFVVGGSPEGRGVVTSASYPARAFGIRSAMPTARALRLCPDLIVVRSRHAVYGRLSREIMDLLNDAAPVVEQLSIDEAFLDVTGAPETGLEIASALQQEIQDQFELSTSWGIATNKLVAKIATEVGKPGGRIEVPPGEEAAFLAPLPVGMLWGVGPKSQERLAGFGVRTIGDLASSEPSQLQTMFGRRGPDLLRRAQGQDGRPVVSERDPKSISAETTFPRDIVDRTALAATLLKLSERVGSRLRKSGLGGSTVRLKLRWPDFTTITRQRALENPTDQDDEIYHACLELFDKVWRRGRPVRLLGVGVANLGPPIRQLQLFDHAWEEDHQLLRAVDSIREKYGSSALRRGVHLRPKDPPAD